MTILSQQIDYTDKDFASINYRIDHLLVAAFPDWTDTARANFGNILKEGNATMMDVVAFYQDQQARESRWGTATQRYAMIELGKLIGYDLDGAEAAQATERFSIPATVTADVPIPAGTRIRTPDQPNPTYFTLLAPVTITAGNTFVDGTVEHSEEFTDAFTAKGERDEKFILDSSPFIDSSQTVLIGIDTWTEVSNFLDSTPTSQHYVVGVDQKDVATITTGDGTNGAIPSTGAAVAITYKTGGGTAGNVEANTITKLLQSSWVDALGRAVSLSATNPLAAAGGLPRETVAQARVQAPRSIRVLNRAVARTDFEDLALQVPGVARALMLTSNQDVTVPEGRGYMYVVPPAGGNPSGALITSVQDFINNNYPPPLNFSWEVRTVTVYNEIDVDVWAYRASGSTEATMIQEIRDALEAFFAPLNTDLTPNTLIDFGYNYKDEDGVSEPIVALSDVSNLINDLPSTRRLGTPQAAEGLRMDGQQLDKILLTREFPELRILTIKDGDTGATIYP